MTEAQLRQHGAAAVVVCKVERHEQRRRTKAAGSSTHALLMTLYLARDDGSGTVLTELGFGHLLEIARLDVGLGENDVAADPKGVEVTYAQSETGVCPETA